ncbi:MAG: hypothetical protein Q8Q52_01435 [Acidimicrobiia bacterium]|nr:hypothetical protein [Acidimicrobiia bacterium]
MPETPDFWDRLEAELRSKAHHRTRRPRGGTRTISRFARSVARPAFHGAMGILTVVIVATMARPAPQFESEPADDIRAGLDALSVWAPVVEVEDPRAPLLAYAIVAKTPRFVSFVGTPQNDSSPDPFDMVAI